MTSPSAEFQRFVYETLIADADVSSFVDDKVFDGPPDDAEYPYIAFGPSDFVPEEQDCVELREETLQLDIWCSDQGRSRICKQIVDACKRALKDAEGELAEHAMDPIRVVIARVIPEPADELAHGIVTISSMIEEN